MDNTTSKSGSVFNMAFAYLNRIDKLLTQASYYSFKGDIISWQKTLRGIYRELCIKLSNDEADLIDGCDKEVYKIGDAVTYKNSTFRNLNLLMNNPSYQRTKRKEILAMLDNIEQKMRRKMQEKDMLLPGRNDPRFAILER